MHETTLYPARVHHQPDEPAYGFLLRTAAHNGAIRPHSVFRRFGVYGALAPTALPVDDVAIACKSDEASLRHATPLVEPSAVVVMGETFDRNQFHAITRRWCPNCLAEHGYHRVWWDLVPVTTCPFHGVDLVSRCECDTPLRTVVNFHDHCRKGHSLAEVKTEPAPEACLVVDRYIVERLLGAKDQGPAHLDATTLEEVIDLADHLGRVLLAPDMKLGSSRRDPRRRHLLAAGFAAIADLDGKFVEALDELASREHAIQKRWGLEKTYGRFYIWLATHHESPARTAMLDAMSRHAASRTTLRGGKVLGRDVQGDASMTIVQAAEACGMTFERFRRLTIALDLVPKTVGQGTPFRLERRVVEELAERLRDNKDLHTIAQELGLADPPVARIAREGHIEFIVAGGFNQKDMNKWILHRDAATNLLRKLDRKVPDQLQTGDNLAELSLAARICRTNVSKILTLIDRGALHIRGLDEKAVGLNRYLIDKGECQVAIRRDRVPGMTLNEAIARLGMSSKTVFSFAQGRLLRTEYHGRVRTVSEEEFERFTREYASVPQLSQLTGLRWGEVKNRLAAAGVAPVAERPKFDQIMFERGRALEVLSERGSR